LIQEHKADKEAAFYIDPPYTLAARRLYQAWQIDHENLFSAMVECKGDFLMSYDNTEEVRKFAKNFGLQAHPIAMKNTHHANMTELLIGRDLRWLLRSRFV
jgi:DNA adenine methylase